MKILFFASILKSHVHQWATWLNMQGHDVTMISDQEPDPHKYHGGLKVIKPRWPAWRNALVFKLRGGRYANNRHKWAVYKPIVDRIRPDIIHAHEALVYGPTLRHFPRYPRVLTPWGPDIEMLANPSLKEERELILQAVESADILTTNGPGLEAHWAKLAGVPAERFRMFSWGVNGSLWKPRSTTEQLNVRVDLEIPPGARIVLSPRLAQNLYRIPLLMDGWMRFQQSLHRDHPGRDARLVVLRAGADTDSWDRIITHHNAINARSIILVDRLLSPPELAALYSTASATIMLPQTDLLAMSLLESMACGSLPIVPAHAAYRTAAVDIGQSPRQDRGFALFIEGEGGIDAIAAAYRRWFELGPDQLASTAAHNTEYIHREHEWEGCAPRIHGVYEEAIQRFRERK